MRRMTEDPGQALVRAHVVVGALVVARRAEHSLDFGGGIAFDVNAATLLALDARCVREMLRLGCTSAPVAARALYRMRYERCAPADAQIPAWRRALDRLLALVDAAEDVPRTGESARDQVERQIDDFAIVAQADAGKAQHARAAVSSDSHAEVVAGAANDEQHLLLRACA